MSARNGMIGWIVFALVGGWSIAAAQDKKDEKGAKPAAKQDAPKKADKPGKNDDSAGKGDKAGDKKDDKAAGHGEMDAQAMEAMMALGRPNENHKLLEYAVGEWDYVIKSFHGPGEPDTSTGTGSTKAIYEGRYFASTAKGKFEMPGPDGKPTTMNFEGSGLTGYDNMKKKFVSSWVDSMSTCIMVLEGTYDAATKSFTYTCEMEDWMVPGSRVKVRQVIRVIDKDHHAMDWYESRGGQEAKTMEISYARKK